MRICRIFSGAAASHLLTGFLQLALMLVIGCFIHIPAVKALDRHCFPMMDDKKPQYVVAYGRMMHENLRSEELHENYNRQVPVWVSGFERGWMTRITSEGKYTTLGAEPELGKRINGILVEAPIGLIKYHDRKQERMCRIRVDPKAIRSMNHQKIPTQGEIWIFTTRDNALKRPSSNYPILMSEVDEFLTGCFQQAKQFNLNNFPEQCVSTTKFWSDHWNNDRIRPLTGRLVEVKRSQINALLSRMKPEQYEKIRQD